MITGKTRTKRVNIVAHVAIRNITPPIYGTLKDVVMTTGDILKCLSKRAKVEEILPDGSTIRLNFSNYYTDNGAGLYVKKEEKARSVKVPEAPVVKNEAPVVETKVEIIPEDNHVEASSADEAAVVDCDDNGTVEEAAATEGNAEPIPVDATDLIHEEPAIEEKPKSKKKKKAIHEEEVPHEETPAVQADEVVEPTAE